MSKQERLKLIELTNMMLWFETLDLENKEAESLLAEAAALIKKAIKADMRELYTSVNNGRISYERLGLVEVSLIKALKLLESL